MDSNKVAVADVVCYFSDTTAPLIRYVREGEGRLASHTILGPAGKDRVQGCRADIPGAAG